MAFTAVSGTPVTRKSKRRYQEIEKDRIHKVVYTVVSRLQRWGNSYGIRLRKQDIGALGLKEGALVDVVVKPHRPTQERDLSDLPTFHDPDPLASIHHDDYLYGPARKSRKKR